MRRGERLGATVAGAVVALLFITAFSGGGADNNALSADVKQALTDAEIPAEIIVDGAELTIRGIVPTVEDAATLIQFVRGIPGVEIVRNELEIVMVEEQPRIVMNVDSIRAVVGGAAPTADRFGDLIEAMTAVAGERRIDNVMILDRTLVSPRWLVGLIEAAPALEVMTKFELSATGDGVVVIGTVADEDDRESVVDALIAGVGPDLLVRGDIRVSG